MNIYALFLLIATAPHFDYRVREVVPVILFIYK